MNEDSPFSENRIGWRDLLAPKIPLINIGRVHHEHRLSGKRIREFKREDVQFYRKNAVSLPCSLKADLPGVSTRSHVRGYVDIKPYHLAGITADRKTPHQLNRDSDLWILLV
jgi:hypothetical protein